IPVHVPPVGETAYRRAVGVLGDDVDHAVPRVVRSGFGHAVGQGGRRQVAVGVVGVAGDAALGVGDLDEAAERVIVVLRHVLGEAGAQAVGHERPVAAGVVGVADVTAVRLGHAHQAPHGRVVVVAPGAVGVADRADQAVAGVGVGFLRAVRHCAGGQP